jgi:hypothetical protein
MPPLDQIKGDMSLLVDEEHPVDGERPVDRVRRLESWGSPRIRALVGGWR